MIRVKICGITRREDALLAVECGADAVGVVNVRESKRFVDVEKAREIFDSLPVFVSRVIVAAPGDMKEAAGLIESDADIIQLHGNESTGFVRGIRKETGLRIIKKVSVDGDCKLNAEKYASIVDAIVLDTITGGLSGGTGVVHDWNVSKEVVCSIDKKVVLAGGLNPVNVGEAVDTVNPYAVDVSSGVELRPGIKDPVKLRRFIELIKSK